MPQMPGGFSMDNMPTGFDMTRMPEGFGSNMPQMPEGFPTESIPADSSIPQMPEGTGTEMPQMTDVTGTEEPQPEKTEENAAAEDVCKSPDCETTEQAKPDKSRTTETRRERPGMGGGGMMQPGGSGSPWGSQSSSNPKTPWIWVGVSVVILFAGLFIAKKFRD
jgi:hypothetical protein